jgi:CBS domain-containing protein
MANLTCEDVMTRHPRSCAPDATLLECIKLMKEQDCGFVPVCERQSGLLLGVLTDRDVAMHLTRDVKPSSVLAREVMHRDPVTCRPELDVFEATRAMERAQVRRIPVVDGDGKLVGVIAHADLARRARQRKDLERELPVIMEETARPSA